MEISTLFGTINKMAVGKQFTIYEHRKLNRLFSRGQNRIELPSSKFGRNVMVITGTSRRTNFLSVFSIRLFPPDSSLIYKNKKRQCQHLQKQARRKLTERFQDSFLEGRFNSVSTKITSLKKIHHQGMFISC